MAVGSDPRRCVGVWRFVINHYWGYGVPRTRDTIPMQPNFWTSARARLYHDLIIDYASDFGGR